MPLRVTDNQSSQLVCAAALVIYVILGCLFFGMICTTSSFPAWAKDAALKITADSDANDSLHSGPHLKGLGVEHRTWTLDHLNQAIRANPKSATLLMERGNLYLGDADIEPAMADFNKAIVLDPHCGKAYIGRSRLYQFMKKWPLAFSELQKAYQMAPPLIALDALYESAFLHRELAQYPQCIAEYDRLLKAGLLSKTRQSYAFYQRGEAYFRFNKPLLALADFAFSLSIDPHNMRVYRVRAKIYQQLNKPLQAISDYSKIIAIDPEKMLDPSEGEALGDLTQVYRERAQIYSDMGRKDLANKDRAAALKVDRQNMDNAPFSLP